MDNKGFMVFDVESTGLHGVGFAVGWVLIDNDGNELDCASYWCNPLENASVREKSTEEYFWVSANVTFPEVCSCKFADEVRDNFWSAWESFRDAGYLLAADVAWPVEARFLCACIDDAITARKWSGPYPLIDIASVRMAAGLDPLGSCERLPSELPMHDPLCDARQSARLLIEALKFAPSRPQEKE